MNSSLVSSRVPRDFMSTVELAIPPASRGQEDGPGPGKSANARPALRLKILSQKSCTPLASRQIMASEFARFRAKTSKQSNLEMMTKQSPRANAMSGGKADATGSAREISSSTTKKETRKIL